MRVAVLPWGDPSRWKYVEYCLTTDAGTPACAAGFSTLELIFKLEELRPDLALVLVPDTLALNAGLGPEACGYGDLVKGVRSYVERHLCVGEAERDRIRVEVLPGVISDPRAKFKTNLADTRLLALYVTYGSFVGAADQERGELEVLLDTTHGVNYFTVLVREAVFEAAAAAAAALGDGVRVSVYNADPVTPPRELERSPEDPCRPTSGVKPPRVVYNPLYEETVRSWDLIRYTRYRQATKLLSDAEGCGFDDEARKAAVAFAERVVSSFRVGALLELAELAAGGEQEDGLSRVSRVLNKARECWAGKAGVRLEGGKLTTSFVKLEDGFRLLIHAHAIAKGVRRLLEAQERRDRHVSMKDLESLKERLLSGSEITRILLERELDYVRYVIHEEKEGKRMLPTDWTLYSAVLGEKPEVDCASKNVDIGKLRRNFVAHVGLLKDLVELRKAEEAKGVELRVKPECWKLVWRILGDVFKSLETQDPRASPGPRSASPSTSSA